MVALCSWRQGQLPSSREGWRRTKLRGAAHLTANGGSGEEVRAQLSNARGSLLGGDHEHHQDRFRYTRAVRFGNGDVRAGGCPAAKHPVHPEGRHPPCAAGYLSSTAANPGLSAGPLLSPVAMLRV